MNFLENINRLRHTRQYKKKFDALMWLSKYRDNHNGHGINEDKLCNQCHITKYEYECVMAGSPLVSIPKCNKVINYIKYAYINSLNKYIFWTAKPQLREMRRIRIDRYTIKYNKFSRNNNLIHNRPVISGSFNNKWISKSYGRNSISNVPAHKKPFITIKLN